MIEMDINGAGPVEVSGPKLLLADDSATIRKVVELTFADEGIRVTAAADASSAMEKFVQTQPDIVLVDVSLPGISGYQICEMIKQDAATSHIPVLLLVGSFEPFDHDEAERVGADGFLTKPFKSIRELVTRVRELLELSPDYVDDNKTQEFLPEPPQMGENAAEMGPIVDETHDIENLYQRSFADTAEIEEFETVDDLLVDAGLDDELIEASYNPDPGPRAVVADADTNPETKSFDWSPSARIEPVNGHDQDKANEIQKAAAADQPQVDGAVLAITDDLVARVSQRVIEQLSDRAVRDIAREVVPRIAEKLIREALAEEKKS